MDRFAVHIKLLWSAIQSVPCSSSTIHSVRPLKKQTLDAAVVRDHAMHGGLKLGLQIQRLPAGFNFAHTDRKYHAPVYSSMPIPPGAAHE